MATTAAFPFADHLPPSSPGSGIPEAKLRALIDEYALALGDTDKAGDTDDAWFHAGRLEALEQTLVLLLDVPHDAWRAHHAG